MTLNQALDKIYDYHDIDSFPEVKRLRTKLSKLKIKHGGNMQIENEKTVKEILKSIENNPKNKK